MKIRHNWNRHIRLPIRLWMANPRVLALSASVQRTRVYDAFNKELIEFKKTDDYKKILMTYGLSEGVEAARTVDTASLCNAKVTLLSPAVP